MASCLRMKTGETYACSACGLTIRVVSPYSCTGGSLRTLLSCCGGPFHRVDGGSGPEEAERMDGETPHDPR